MHPCALAERLFFEARALPADAERVVDRVALDAHRAPASRAANGDRVSAEAVAQVLRPHDVLDGASRDLGEPAAFGTRDHRPCVAAGLGEAPLTGKRYCTVFYGGDSIRTATHSSNAKRPA